MNEPRQRRDDFVSVKRQRFKLIDRHSRAGSSGDRDANASNIHVNAYQLVLSYWATKHIRLTAEYSLYRFPGTPKTENQAIAPE